MAFFGLIVAAGMRLQEKRVRADGAGIAWVQAGCVLDGSYPKC